MDRQAVFKKVSKIIVPIEIVFIITSAIAAGVIFYVTINRLLEANDIKLQLTNSTLVFMIIYLVLISIIFASGFILSLVENRLFTKNDFKKIVIISSVIFSLFVIAILYEFTFIDFEYFPSIFLGSAFITILCKVLALTPNGLRAKLIQYINSLRNGE